MEHNLPPHWGSNPLTSVYEANPLQLTPQLTHGSLISSKISPVSMPPSPCFQSRIILNYYSPAEEINAQMSLPPMPYLVSTPL